MGKLKIIITVIIILCFIISINFYIKTKQMRDLNKYYNENENEIKNFFDLK